MFSCSPCCRNFDFEYDCLRPIYNHRYIATIYVLAIIGIITALSLQHINASTKGIIGCAAVGLHIGAAVIYRFRNRKVEIPPPPPPPIPEVEDIPTPPIPEVEDSPRGRSASTYLGPWNLNNSEDNCDGVDQRDPPYTGYDPYIGEKPPRYKDREGNEYRCYDE